MGASLSFRDRLVAWWEGYELEERPADEDDESEPEADAAEGEAPDEDAPEAQSHGSALRTLLERLKAWWEGYELPEAEKDEDEERPEEGREPPPKAVSPSAEEPDKSEEPDRSDESDESEGPKPRVEEWTAARIEVVERIWGAGFTSPGGDEYVLKLVKPFALNPEMSLCHLSAGLGGGARVIADAFGIWVTGMEPSEVLASHGMEESTLAGMAKKAPITAYDPESLELREKGFDCIFSKESFFTVVDKAQLFETIERALKRGGQLLFTDYLLAKSDGRGPQVDDWVANEPVRPDLWSIEQTCEFLEGLKLEIRIHEDISDELCSLAYNGWYEALRGLKPGQIGHDLGETLIREAEIWTRRIEVLESGDVRVYRVHAFKP